MVKSRSEIAAVVSQYVSNLVGQGIDVERVYLYGSHLHGGAHEWSDVDVVVVSHAWEGLGLWDRAGHTGRARSQTFDATGESVEALARTPEELSNLHPASFLAEVLKEAEVIYERKPAKV